MATPAAPTMKFDNSEYVEPAKKDLTGETCFLMDFFRERLPLEYNGGSSLTRAREAEPKKEKVLIFADSYGFCPNEKTGEKGFSFWTPEDRNGANKIVSTPPSELTESEPTDIAELACSSRAGPDAASSTDFSASDSSPSLFTSFE